MTCTTRWSEPNAEGSGLRPRIGVRGRSDDRPYTGSETTRQRHSGGSRNPEGRWGGLALSPRKTVMKQAKGRLRDVARPVRRGSPTQTPRGLDSGPPEADTGQALRRSDLGRGAGPALRHYYENRPLRRPLVRDLRHPIVNSAPRSSFRRKPESRGAVGRSGALAAQDGHEASERPAPRRGATCTTR